MAEEFNMFRAVSFCCGIFAVFFNIVFPQSVLRIINFIVTEPDICYVVFMVAMCVAITLSHFHKKQFSLIKQQWIIHDGKQINHNSILYDFGLENDEGLFLGIAPLKHGLSYDE